MQHKLDNAARIGYSYNEQDFCLSKKEQLLQQLQQNKMIQESSKTRYKTELCRSFKENGICKYGEKCQFAHGEPEVRNINRHPKFKTELCRTFHISGYCPYGPRCHFVHDSVESRKLHNRQPLEIQTADTTDKLSLSESSDLDFFALNDEIISPINIQSSCSSFLKDSSDSATDTSSRTCSSANTTPPTSRRTLQYQTPEFSIQSPKFSTPKSKNGPGSFAYCKPNNALSKFQVPLASEESLEAKALEFNLLKLKFLELESAVRNNSNILLPLNETSSNSSRLTADTTTCSSASITPPASRNISPIHKNLNLNKFKQTCRATEFPKANFNLALENNNNNVEILKKIDSAILAFIKTN